MTDAGPLSFSAGCGDFFNPKDVPELVMCLVGAEPRRVRFGSRGSLRAHRVSMLVPTLLASADQTFYGP